MTSTIPHQPTSPTQSTAHKKWKLLQNIFRALTLLRIHETRTMHDIDDLIADLKSSPLKDRIKRQPSLTAESIDEHKQREKLFNYIFNSTAEDLEKIKDLIENNPKRFSVSATIPESLLNKALKSNRPIYEACKLGHVETVRLLLRYGANPYLKSGKGFKESCLEVACRWRHQAVVSVLLEECDWSSLDLKRAMKGTSEVICGKIKEKIPAEHGCKCEVF